LWLPDEGFLVNRNMLHTPHRSQYAAITLTASCTAPTYLLLTKCVILAKYRLWFPDDGFLVNRNMLHKPHRSQYAAITLTTSCKTSTYLLLTECVIFS